MKLTSGWWRAGMRQRPDSGTGKGVHTSLPPPPRRCVIFSWIEPAASAVENGAEDRVRVAFDEANPACIEDSDEVLAVDEALAGLAAADARAAELVKRRYFAGLSIPEAAEALNISPRSADRLWAYARAWLRRAIAGP
jgi:DNA-directed RNA polymerase specialized sigma24 family protein